MDKYANHVDAAQFIHDLPLYVSCSFYVDLHVPSDRNKFYYMYIGCC